MRVLYMCAPRSWRIALLAVAMLGMVVSQRPSVDVRVRQYEYAAKTQLDSYKR
jgi:hypothetical protein